MQYLLREVLRFPGLRPVQEQAIAPVLDGRDCVILAPTAGGKTEAAVLPAWSRVLAEGWPRTSILYICPLRALLNNQDGRLTRMAESVGLKVGKWHGDVAAGERKRLLAEPPDLLLITPESIEVLLIRPSGGAAQLLDQVRLAIVDEVHAFANDARGAHLVSLLERLQHRTGRHIQRVGLSATVGNPQALAHWLQGSGAALPPQVVDPGGHRKVPQLTFDIGPDVAWAAAVIRNKGMAQKQLAFVQSRTQAERLSAALGPKARAWIHHSAVGRSRRTEAELAFESEPSGTLVATSSMELGIDVGDLDEVIQLDAPGTVASLAQRLGRTGRRASTLPRMTFLAESPEDLIVSLALAELFLTGWVEDVVPSTRNWPVLVHQIFANLLESSGLSRGQLLDRLRLVPAFAGFDDRDLARLIDHLLSQGWLDADGGLLLLGRRAEKVFGAKNFFRLYAVFESPDALSVRWGQDEIGTIQAWFALQLRGARPTIRLAGRAWRITHLDSQRGVVQVEPGEHGDAPSWTGRPVSYSRKVCEQILDLIVSGRTPDGCTPAARAALESVRRELEPAGLGEKVRPLQEVKDRTVWHTFAGGRINAVLARLLELELGAQVSFSNLSVKIQARGARVREAVEVVINQLGSGQLPPDELWAAFDTERKAAVLSAFQECLPGEIEQEFLRGEFLGVGLAVGWVARPTAGRNPEL
jgi:ATP-dependent Lhr-like helicase